MFRFIDWKNGVTIIFLCFLSFANSLSAQPLPIGDPITEYLRIMDIRGQLESSASWNIQPLRYEWLSRSEDSLITFANPWSKKINPYLEDKSEKQLEYKFFNPKFFQSYNTKAPSGINDGALWQGRGYNTSFSTGFWTSFSIFEIALRPEFGYSQNKDFELSLFSELRGRNELSNPFLFIDMPQRFGYESFSWVNLGNSYIRANAGPVSVGFSNQHHWIGSAWYNPIMMSNNAPGFRHVFLETAEPLKTFLGDFESKIIWGALQESDYFFLSATGSRRFLSNLTLIYTPSFWEEISFSFSRTFYEDWPDNGLKFRNISKIVEPFFKENFATDDNPSGNDEADQMFSIGARWKFENSGSEIYAELSRNDHSWDFRDFILEPEHSRAFYVGAIKTIDVSSSQFLKLQFEITQLELAKTELYRGGQSYYIHSRVRQGYTNRGQVIGAGIGPGSNSQLFKTSFFDTWGRASIFINRIVNNNDALIDNLPAIWRGNGRSPLNSMRTLHDVELHIGASSTIFFNDFEVDLKLYRMRQFNRYYYFRDNQTNYHFEMTLRYTFERFLR